MKQHTRMLQFCVWLLILSALLFQSSPPTLAQTAPSYFVPDQVIVTGRSTAVDAVILGIPLSSTRLVRIERTDLGYTDGLPPAAPFPFPVGRATLVMDLYRILDGTSVPVMVRTINAAAVASGAIVYADPNYAIGRPPSLTTADPWSIEADPASGSSAAAQDLFWQQWAFGNQGIGLFERSQTGRSVPFTGFAVRVAIFDTSPFVLTGNITRTLRTIDWISPTLNLDVYHPTVMYTWFEPNNAINARNHGLFVAGLVHAVAPESKISLIKILDQYGQGDLYTLSRQMHAFNKETLQAGALYDGAVINLSLGVHPPPNAAALQLPSDIRALQTATLAADGFEIVVVAAAGNDSGNAIAAPLQLPAAYDSVIGVAGSNSQRGRSCFSNQGNLAAPAGNGIGTDCDPSTKGENGIISLMLPSLLLGSGYAVWPGTSFATPMASGVAALLLDAQAGDFTPAQVATAMELGALPPSVPADTEALGAGIINLRRILLPYNGNLPFVVANE